MSHDDLFAEIGASETEGSSRGARASRVARRRRRLRRRLVTFLVLVLALAGVAFGAYKAMDVVRDASATQTQVSDYTGAGEDEVLVTIPEGASGAGIGKVLKDAGVVATVGAFTDAYNANANSGSIQAGTYTLRTRMSAANAVAALLDPAAKSDHTITVPEGYTKQQVKERLMSVGGFTDQEVEAAYADTAAIGLPAVAGGDVEGWLAPSTYDVTEDATATDVVASMVSTTLTSLRKLGVEEQDYETVLTKASIIENEVADATYYGQVARVIENRLKDTDGETSGFLQMDSTVLYGLGRTGGIPTAGEVTDKSNTYNTYQHAGLTPSPIGSPGQKAVAAVINPPEGTWLYFVTVDLKTGETLFATTFKDQEKNTEELTAYCKANAEVCSGASPSAAGTSAG